MENKTIYSEVDLSMLKFDVLSMKCKETSLQIENKL
jgi:hypothetical protein